MFQCSNAQMFKCPNLECSNVQMFKSLNVPNSIYMNLYLVVKVRCVNGRSSIYINLYLVVKVRCVNGLSSIYMWLLRSGVSMDGVVYICSL